MMNEAIAAVTVSATAASIAAVHTAEPVDRPR